MNLICKNQFHITVNSRSSIPSGISILRMIYSDSNHISSTKINIRCQIIHKGNISVRTFSNPLTVYKNFAVIINALKIDINIFTLFIFRDFQHLTIPSYTTRQISSTTGQRRVSLLFNTPVMRQIKLSPRRIVIKLRATIFNVAQMKTPATVYYMCIAKTLSINYRYISYIGQKKEKENNLMFHGFIVLF